MHSSPKGLPQGLVVAVAPVLLLLLICAGFRYASDHAMAATDAEDTAPLLKSSGKPHRPRPTPIPQVPVDASTQKVLEGTARSQIEALSRSDFAHALDYAAPEARGAWHVDQFRDMILQGFTPLTRASRTEFLQASGANGMCSLPFTVIDPAGVRTEYVYRLQLTPDGHAFVIGCGQIFPRAPVPPPVHKTPSNLGTQSL